MGLISKEHSKNKANFEMLYPTYLDTTNPKFLLLNNMYVSSFLVVNYNKEMEGGFLDKLLSLGIDMQISMYYEKQNTNEVLKKLTYHIGNTGADIKNSNENQIDINIMQRTYMDAKYIREKMQLDDEELYYVYIYILVYSNSIKKLEVNMRRIENVAASAGVTLQRANYKHENVLVSSLPLMKNNELLKRITKRNVLTDGLSSTYPFLLNDLCDEDGVFIGVNEFNNSLVMVDRFKTDKYKNANMFIVGTSGSGKSYFTKLMVERNRFLNISQYIVDPDREYTKLCEKLGGTLIDFKTTTINVMEIRETTKEGNESYLENKLGKLKAFFEIIFKEITEEEKSFLEDKIIECYKQKGITFDDASLYKKLNNQFVFKESIDMPRIEDLYNLIIEDEKLLKYKSILKPYVKGSMKYLNCYTNVDLSNKIVVSDIFDIEEKDLPIVMYIITEFYWDKIKENRAEKKILYLDEVWRLINNSRETAEFVFKVFKTIRKYGGAATAITQDINDFFALDDGKFGKGIINNSSIKCMFQLEENDIKNLESIINLSKNEKFKLQAMNRGTSLLCCRKRAYYSKNRII